MSLKRNTLWNLAGMGVPLIAGVAFIPFTLARLGGEAFGVVTLIWALIGYFGLFDMGVGRALTYEISKLRVEGLGCQISGTLKAGIIVTIITGILGAVVMLLLAPWLAHDWLKVSEQLQSDTRLAFQIAALGVVPTTMTSGLRGALEGFERFAESNLIRMFFGLAMFALPALSVLLHGNAIWCIALYLVGARLVVVVLSLAKLRVQLSEKTNFLAIYKHTCTLFSYGIWVTISGIVGPLMIYGDRFFVGAAVGAEQLPYYAIPQEGLQRLLIVPAALCGALLPKLSANRDNSLMQEYSLNYRRIAIVMFIVCATAATLAYPVLAWWLSRDFAIKAIPLVLVLTIGIWFNSVAQLPYTVLHALGQPRTTAIFHLFELGFYFVLLYVLAMNYGLLGAAIAWVVRVLLDLVLLQFSANKLLNKGKYIVKS